MIRLKHSLKIKILSIFIIIFIILIANTIWAVLNFNRLNQSIENIMVSNYKTIEAAQNMISLLDKQFKTEFFHIFSDSSDTVINPYFKITEKKIFEQLFIAENNITEPGEPEILKNISEYYIKYINSIVELKNNDLVSNSDDFKKHYFNVIFPLYETLKNECQQLINLNQEGMIIRKNKAKSTANKASYSTVTISLLTIFFGLFIATYLANKIIKPVYTLINNIKNIADGNYEQKIDVYGNDEISRLAVEFNKMTAKLQIYRQLNLKKLKSEKQKAEAIVESIDDGILVTDKDNKILLINLKFEKIFNIKEKDVVKKHFLEVINNENIFNIIKNVNENKFVENEKPLTISLTDGDNKKHYRIYARPIITKDKESIGVVTLFQDITKLKEVDKLKSDFVSTVSHEFKTPLTSISMGVNLLLEEKSGKLEEKQKNTIIAIKEDAERLNDLVTDLLDLSKIESGKIEMDFGKYNINDIIEKAVKPFEIQFEKKNIDFEFNSSKSNIKVKADFNKVTWVLTNLIGNAIRYVPKDGTGKIIIEVKETSNKVLVKVSDNGVGIPYEIKNKIFEKFVQSDDDNKGNTGLGLAISKEIINAHGGQIWVESETGKGAAFLFTLYKK